MIEAIDGFRGDGIEIQPILPSGGEVAAEWLELGIAIDFASMTSWVTNDGPVSWRDRAYAVREAIRDGRDLARTLKAVRPDLVVTNTLVSPVGAIAARLLRVPHVWYLHEMGGADMGMAFHFGEPVTFNMINTLSRQLITVSDAVTDHFARIIPVRKMHRIYCAPETPARPTKGRRGGVLEAVMVGSLYRHKRQDDAIKAFALLADRGLQARLTIVGTGPEAQHAYLRDLVAQLGISERIRFAGPVPSQFDHFANADVALMCSAREAFGRVTVEAMKMGTPVIGTRSGGTAELIKHGVNGFLYEPGDVVELAARIEDAIRDRPALARMGEAAARWANERFDSARFRNDVLRVFRLATA